MGVFYVGSVAFMLILLFFVIKLFAFVGLVIIFVMRDKRTTFMKKYIIPILVLAAFVVLPWTFNHINPYVGIILTMVLVIYVIDRIAKKFN